MTKPKMRNSNIELLRILLIMMVIGLHYNTISMGNAFEYTQLAGINISLTHLIESFMIMSVDTFLIITGYFLSTQKSIKVNKIIEMIILLLVLKIVIYFIDLIAYGAHFDIKIVIQELVSGNWYITKYIILYIFSPYINNMLNSLNKKEYKRLIILIVCIFMILPLILNAIADFFDVNGWAPVTESVADHGYTIVTFFVMYIVGAYIRKEKIELELKYSFLGYLGCAIAIFLIYYIPTKIGLETLASTCFRYNNVFVALEGVFLFLFFNKLNIPNNKIINTVATATLSIFIVSTSTPFIKLYNVLQVSKYSITNYLIPHFIVTCIVIYILSLIVGLSTLTILKITVYKKLKKHFN